MDVFAAFAKLDRQGKKKLAKRILSECAQYPQELVQIPITPTMFTDGIPSPVEIWRSRGYAVQVFDINSQWFHIKINRNAFTLQFDRFLDGITWETIMRLKAEIGRSALEAVEVFPSEADVQESKLRHIWLRKTGSIIDDWGIGWKARNEPARVLPIAFSVDSSSIDPMQLVLPIVARKDVSTQQTTSEPVQDAS
jgi:hypothetical protein